MRKSKQPADAYKVQLSLGQEFGSMTAVDKRTINIKPETKKEPSERGQFFTGKTKKK